MPKFPDGEIVGQSVNLGHVLRENRHFDVPPDNWQTSKVAIIGGGVAGLTAAWKFRKENFNDFVLLELEKEIGGTARSGVGDPVSYPWG
ncbi:MAG TPA: NAD(P)-binding protein, partial [Pyrinomonadaceae bacterium]|nr:NAD(P)-binding protein [Pyrinomonadaceae bacterium]